VNQSFYESSSATQSEIIGGKPKSLALAIALSLLGGPYIAMLYLGRPIRFVIYTCVAIIIYYEALSSYIDIGVERSAIEVGIGLLFMVGGTIDAAMICRRIPLGLQMPLYSRWYVIIPATILLLVAIYTIRIFAIEPYSMSSNSMLPNLKKGQQMLISKTKSAKFTFAGETLRERSNKKMHLLAVRGNIVVYIPSHNQSSFFVGRIIGIPGDVITFDGHSYTIERCVSEVCTSIFLENTVLDSDYDLTKLNPKTISTNAELSSEDLDGLVFNVLHFSRVDGKSCGSKECGTIKVAKGHVFILGDNRDNSFDSRYTGSVPIENIIGELL
jgi:signal peptidase I